MAVEARDARAAAQPLELGGIVVHVGGMGLVPALRQPVEQRDGVPLGAAVSQRTGDEKNLHLRFRTSSTSAKLPTSTVEPTASRTNGAASARKCRVTSQASSAQPAAISAVRTSA